MSPFTQGYLYNIHTKNAFTKRSRNFFACLKEICLTFRLQVLRKVWVKRPTLVSIDLFLNSITLWKSQMCVITSKTTVKLFKSMIISSLSNLPTISLLIRLRMVQIWRFRGSFLNPFSANLIYNLCYISVELANIILDDLKLQHLNYNMTENWETLFS